MTKRKSKTKKVRKIMQIGGYSYAITLPMDTVKKFGWKEKTKTTTNC